MNQSSQPEKPMQSTVAKGTELEHQFATYMRSELKWDKTRVKAWLPSSKNSKGFEIDILGLKYNGRGKWLNILGVGYVILWAIIAYVLYKRDGGIDLVRSIVIIVLIIGGAFMIWISPKYKQDAAWVECKNTKAQTDINEIRISLHQLHDYNKFKTKKYRFTTHYFVSSSGYKESALRFALENKIICYEKGNNGEFIKSDYWKQ